MDMVGQYEVFWVNLDPTIGHEIKKTRPCVIVSPNELNSGLRTVLAAPLTSTQKNYPFRLTCVIDGKKGSVALDQTRCIDQTRLIKKMGELNGVEIKKLKAILHEMLIE